MDLNEDIIKDVSIRRHGHSSLYTWVRQNITERLLRRRNQLVQISLIREDGFNISYDITNDNYTDSNYDETNNKKIAFRIEEAISAIKYARMHERILLFVRSTGVDLSGKFFDDQELYLIIRFSDKEYNHITFGPKVKQIIAAEQISIDYIKDYVNHFTISGKITEIASNKKLVSIISFNQIDSEKIKNLREHLGDDDPSILEINKSLIDIHNLSIIYNALSEKEKERLKSLPFLGHPNYTITHDLKLKVYLKSSTAEAFGNGNAVSFYLT